VNGFERKNLLFSLCGLNCGLYLMQLDGQCPGCVGGDGNSPVNLKGVDKRGFERMYKQYRR